MGFTGHRRDRCKVLSHSTAAGRDPQAGGWTEGSEIRCTYIRRAARQVASGSDVALTDIALTNVQFFLPGGTAIESANRVRLTKLRNSTAGLPEDYQVVGEPFMALNGVVVDAQRIEPLRST